MECEILFEGATAVATIGMLAVAYWQLRKMNEQNKQTFFAEYTKRYQKVMLHLPEKIYDRNFDTAQLTEDQKAYLRAYFDLCSEEYFLYQSKQIDEKVWKEWEQGIISSFEKTAIGNYWDSFIKDKVYYYTDFKGYIDTKVKKGVIPKSL